MLLIGSNKGFTLIEILIAVVLIGVVVGITLPNFAGLMKTIDFKTTSRKVINLFNKLSVKAITDGQKQEVKIEKNQLIYRSPSGRKQVFGKEIREIKLSKGRTPICFYPNGSSSGANLLLVTNEGQKIEVTIDKITAEAAVVDSK
ncbi:prepilin-type N-terminal cleavage/methylation domain-containing protein [Sporohalobacter salinus]|uniref:prepilin-type N-terminal cleavage/methylation domain-containing protein n=1 Tax=Sporohalobacter salinus TaxID=1494606 RepID=UPI0019602F50|nr:prepilin-type N-terminal cleavage/methylation domain-containing protein [Sporohalobacter salinus]MBM7623784.1 general secretion pathway protein H [Sporohalobacter salinus]